MKNISKLKKIPDLAKDEGVLYDDPQKNYQAIYQHATSAAHRRHVEDLIKLHDQMGGDDIFKKIMTMSHDQNPLDDPTKTVLTTVYYEAQLGISNNVHPYFIELLRRFKVIVGENYCQTRHYARQATISMASTMNKILANSLRQSNFPASIRYSIIVEK